MSTLPQPIVYPTHSRWVGWVLALGLAVAGSAGADRPPTGSLPEPGTPGDKVGVKAEVPELVEPLGREPNRPRVPAISAIGRAQALVDRADEAAWRGEAITARRLYRRALLLVPELPSALFGLGSLAASEGAVDEATEFFRRAAAADPSHRDAHFNLAVALIRRDQLSEAAETLEQVLALDGRDREARRWLVRILLRLGQGDDELALVALRRAVNLAPEQAATHLALAQALARQGRFDGALESYGRTLELDPTQAEAHLGRATALLLARRFDETRQALEASLDTLGPAVGEPIRQGLRHALARLLASCPDATVRDGETALALALAVFERQPLPAHGETVAMAYAELGRFDLARHWQQRMVDAMDGGEPLAEARHRLALYAAGEPYRGP